MRVDQSIDRTRVLGLRTLLTGNFSLMESIVNDVPVFYEERGEGRPALLLHGAGVDHQEIMGAMEPAFVSLDAYRRIYPDLPGMGRTPAPDEIASADDVLDVLLGLVEARIGDDDFVVAGHSAGAYYARAIAERCRERAAGLAVICPLFDGLRDVPQHVVMHTSEPLDEPLSPPDLEVFRDYFVVHTPETLEAYRAYVEPSLPLVDHEALERIGERWTLTPRYAPLGPYERPTLIVTGRQDSTVGFAGQWDAAERYPHATFAVLDRAGHALLHEQPALLSALVTEWLRRVEEQLEARAP
jgi:pimeloyl-ACP methyl ester carboxylesterase